MHSIQIGPHEIQGCPPTFGMVQMNAPMELIEQERIFPQSPCADFLFLHVRLSLGQCENHLSLSIIGTSSGNFYWEDGQREGAGVQARRMKQPTGTWIFLISSLGEERVSLLVGWLASNSLEMKSSTRHMWCGRSFFRFTVVSGDLENLVFFDYLVIGLWTLEIELLCGWKHFLFYFIFLEHLKNSKCFPSKVQSEMLKAV